MPMMLLFKHDHLGTIRPTFLETGCHGSGDDCGKKTWEQSKGGGCACVSRGFI
ncbi:hypothetical protein [Paenibacillus selenitireducens]|uniref:hypothetical protein n=1 Tax=Paenibacillus selenitireducens TaxID=1324314 RepID=UPI001301F7C9|nr:hypothetical protein [Paenibacillus selenitireducens]